MGLLPKGMLREALQLSGLSVVPASATDDESSGGSSGSSGSSGSNSNNLHVVRVDHHSGAFNETAYLDLAWRLLSFTRRHLTTAAIARYVLRVTGHWNSSSSGGGGGGGGARGGGLRVLVLGASREEDYVRDLFVHGLRSLLRSKEGGPLVEVVDAVRPPHMYLPATIPTTNSEGSDGGGANEEATEGKEAPLYGNGFSYSRWIPDDDYNDYDVDDGYDNIDDGYGAEEESLRERILRRGFDLVVYGSVHRGVPFWPEVQAAGYGRANVAFLDGEDEHFGGWGAPAARVLDKGHYFMREIPDGCPPLSLFARD